jgi:hypothetical protein
MTFVTRLPASFIMFIRLGDLTLHFFRRSMETIVSIVTTSNKLSISPGAEKNWKQSISTYLHAKPAANAVT